MAKTETKTVWQRFGELQVALGVINKDAVNPHFRNKYASLSAIQEAVIGKVGEFGFVVKTSFTAWEVVTELVDIETGETINQAVFPFGTGTPQNMGSAITYGKRYGLSAVLNLRIDEDDDGNGAENTSKPVEKVNKAHAKVLAGLLTQLPADRFKAWQDRFGCKTADDVPACDFETRCEELRKVLGSLEANE